MQITKTKTITTREIRNFGFTLLEVLISLVIIGAGVAFSTKVFVAGKYFLKEAENKARAMEIASLKMNEYITQSYKDLVEGTTTNTYPADFFGWTVKVTGKTQAKIAPGVNNIPYKEIEVICSYSETDINGVSSVKKVRLINMVPYPNMHLYSANGPTSLIDTTAHKDSDTCIITLPINLEVKSDLLIFYNISIDIQTPPAGWTNGILPLDLIITKCYYLKPGSAILNPVEIQTGTPILTQPTINNIVSIVGLKANAKKPYTLQIYWHKDNERYRLATKKTGGVTLKKINIAVFQSENSS